MSTTGSGADGGSGGTQGAEASGSGGTSAATGGASQGTGGSETAGTGGAPSSGDSGGASSGNGGAGGSITAGDTGSAGSGASATGGNTGTGGGFSNSDPATWGDRDLAIDAVPLESDAGYCEPPCAVELADNGDLVVIDGLSAGLYIDFDTLEVGLYQDMSLANDAAFAVGFTYEDNQYGYSAYFRAPMTDIFALNLEYTTNLDYEWEYSMWQDEVITFEIASYSEQKMALVSFSFGDKLVRVHEVKIPSCSTSRTQGACTNAADCPLVDAGTGWQSAECGDCYAGIDSCTATYCQAECAEDLAGNSCLRCQTDAGCHLEFMQCSGLDFIPWNSLEFAEW